MEWAAAQIAQVLTDRPGLLIISDSTVALLYEKSLSAALKAHGFEVSSVIFEPGEAHKNFRTASFLLNELVDRKFAREDVIIGLGGGVTTDIAGFIASIYQRGIRWIAVPTTLMGMADAAIGGKTGVNHPFGKNLIGTFHQPLAVFAPLQTLDTLPPREWSSGSAEVVKAALLSGDELWADVERYGPNLKTWSREKLLKVIVDTASLKIKIVEQDEKESGLRRLLNLGHTFGHALEAATRYDTYRHGEAIFLGLRAAVRLSEKHGLMPKDTAGRIERVLSQAVTPTANVRPKALLSALDHDKKVRSRSLHWILLKKPGEPEIISDLPHEFVEETGEWLCDLVRSGVLPDSGMTRPHILILNGPNLNLLGEREPALYGTTTYNELEKRLQDLAESEDVEILVRQSNVEGELVTLIQQARHWADGIIINPGGYTHTSVAIRDAMAAVALPTIEVHLTDISTREDFRRVSLISPVCNSVISGKGVEGYFDALRMLKTLIEKFPPQRETAGAKEISQ